MGVLGVAGVAVRSGLESTDIIRDLRETTISGERGHGKRLYDRAYDNKEDTLDGLKYVLGGTALAGLIGLGLYGTRRR